MPLLAIDIGQGADDLTPVGVVGLPVAVTTSAWLAGGDDGLHLLVGEPQIGATAHILLRQGATTLTALPPLPLVAAGVACGPDGLAITGANAAGDALIIGVSQAGESLWRCALEGPPPIRWYVPFAMPELAVVWQVAANRIEIASIDGGVLRGRESIPVGGPPLTIAAGAGRLWAAWAEDRVTRAVVCGRDGVSYWTAAEAKADAIAIGACNEHAWMAWSAAGETFLSDLESGCAGVRIELGRAAGGALVVAPGPFPIVWAQQAVSNAWGERIYVSALARPGRLPILFEGLVHAVAWCCGRLAVLGSTDLWLFTAHNGATARVDRVNRG
jgi:hypothetical protein